VGTRLLLHHYEVNLPAWIPTSMQIEPLILYSALIYLDYAAVFPYTGGEIVYVSISLSKVLSLRSNCKS
jgi:hypothetical protein